MRPSDLFAAVAVTAVGRWLVTDQIRTLRQSTRGSETGLDARRICVLERMRDELLRDGIALALGGIPRGGGRRDERGNAALQAIERAIERLRVDHAEERATVVMPPGSVQPPLLKRKEPKR